MNSRLSVASVCCATLRSSAVVATAQYTEVPATVQPGRFLLEADALSLVLDREGTERYTAVAAGAFFVSTGLTSRWDVQLGASLFVTQRYEQGGLTDRNSGIGDVYVRTKWNFVANEWVSAAILPYAKIPTASGGVGNDDVEGGVILPWEVYLPAAITVNSMVEVARMRNATDDGYGTFFRASSSDSRQVTRFLSLYAEFDAAKTAGGGPWQSTLGVGAFLTVSDAVSWDLALYRGLNRHAPDWNPVVRFNVGF